MLTIFTIPKPFTKKHISLIQENAIQSWIQLRPKPEIILVGEEKGIKKIADKYKLKQIRQVKRNKYGTPLLSSAFNQVRQKANHDVLCYLNADIITLPNFTKILKHLPKKEFLVVGQRWNLDIKKPIKFQQKNWSKKIEEQIKKEGRLCQGWGSDYFIFRKECFQKIPDFAVGRVKWDNWMIYEARRQKMMTINATFLATLVHQRHDYSHQLDGGNKDKNIEAKENLALAGGDKHVFLLEDANYQIAPGGLEKKKITKQRILRFFWYWKNTPEILAGSKILWQKTQPIGVRLYFYIKKFILPANTGIKKIDDAYLRWLNLANAGMMHPGNLYCFDYALKNLPSNKPALEIGAFCGLSTNVITHFLHKYQKKNKVITVDKWIFEGSDRGKIGQSNINHKQYKHYVKRSFIRNIKFFSRHNLPYAIEQFSDDFFKLWQAKRRVKDVLGRIVKLGGKVSFCYIDGNHQYKFVKNDFQNTDRILEKGGFLLFDDSADSGSFDARKVAQEVGQNKRYRLICKNPNYLFQKVK